MSDNLLPEEHKILADWLGKDCLYTGRVLFKDGAFIYPPEDPTADEDVIWEEDDRYGSINALCDGYVETQSGGNHSEVDDLNMCAAEIVASKGEHVGEVLSVFWQETIWQERDDVQYYTVPEYDSIIFVRNDGVSKESSCLSSIDVKAACAKVVREVIGDYQGAEMDLSWGTFSSDVFSKDELDRILKGDEDDDSDFLYDDDEGCL